MLYAQVSLSVLILKRLPKTSPQTSAEISFLTFLNLPLEGGPISHDVTGYIFEKPSHAGL